MSLAILFHFLCCASACNTDTTPTQPHRNSNTYRNKNNMTNVVIQQNIRKLLMMDILMSETCWAHKMWNKRVSDIKFVFSSSTSGIFCFISLFHATTCFEHYVLIIMRSKLYYTASGIVTPVGSRPVHRFREDSTCAPAGHLQVWRYQMLYNTILTSWWWAYSARNM